MLRTVTRLTCRHEVDAQYDEQPHGDLHGARSPHQQQDAVDHVVDDEDVQRVAAELEFRPGRQYSRMLSGMRGSPGSRVARRTSKACRTARTS